MAYGEYLFGRRRILIETRADRSSTAQRRFVATAHLILNGGRELQAVGDSAGRRLQLGANSDDEAMDQMSSYLESRFGERADAPELANEPMTRVQLRPPLKDERAEAPEP